MGRTIEEQRAVYLQHILTNLERLHQSYTADDPEWEILSKIEDLLEELED